MGSGVSLTPQPIYPSGKIPWCLLKWEVRCTARAISPTGNRTRLQVAVVWLADSYNCCSTAGPIATYYRRLTHEPRSPQYTKRFSACYRNGQLIIWSRNSLLDFKLKYVIINSWQTPILHPR